MTEDEHMQQEEQPQEGHGPQEETGTEQQETSSPQQDEGQGAAPGSQEALQQELEKKDEKIAELNEAVKRQQAEFDNFRKRLEKERETLEQNANKRVIEKLLPTMDHVDLAVQNSHNPDEFIKGTMLIFEQLRELLKNEGVEEIDAKDKAFDPQCEEAMLTEEAPGKDGVVTEVLQKGYTLNQSLLRPAKVKVGKEPQCKNEDTGNNTQGTDTHKEQ